MNEIWKDVVGYENRYMVSNLGRVKRLPNGKGSNLKELIKSTNRRSKDGYVMITLPNGEKPLHRLVAEAFIPNPYNKETVNHIDGNKLNNCVTNLEWATRHEQLQHAYKLGLKKPIRGSENVNSKLTDNDVAYIRRVYKPRSKEFGAKALGNKFDVDLQTIMNVIKFRTYQ